MLQCYNFHIFTFLSYLIIFTDTLFRLHLKNNYDQRILSMQSELDELR